MAEADDAFMADPLAFMAGNVVRVNCGKAVRGTYGFLLERKETVARSGTRRGKLVPFYFMTQREGGPIDAYWLPYQENAAKDATLGIGHGDPRFMFTVNMNGCSFGWVQGEDRGALVSHHNDRAGDNSAETIEGQALESGDKPEGFRFFHQSAYRTPLNRGTGYDRLYQATVMGIRTGTRWKFYCQRRKDLGAVKGAPAWTLKGIVEINP